MADWLKTAGRRLLIVPPLALGILIIMISASQRQAPARTDGAPPAIPARYIVAEVMPVAPRVVGFGVSEPARTWSAIVESAGRIDFVHPDFRRGGAVSAGDALIRIAPQDYELALAQAEASIASVTAQIDELDASLENTEQSLVIEKRSLEIAEAELQRQRALVERGAGSRAAADNQERSVLSQRAVVQNLENSLRQIPPQRRRLEQERAVQVASRDAAAIDLARTVLTAPFDARIAEADAEQGQFAGAGAVLGLLDGVDAAEIDAKFPQNRMADFARLTFLGAQAKAAAAGDPEPDLDALLGGTVQERLARMREIGGLRAVAQLRFGDNSSVWQGTVSRIAETLDPETRAVGLIVRIEDPNRFEGRTNAPRGRAPLLKGSFLQVTLIADPADGLIPIPRAAVRRGPDGGAEVLLAAAGDVLERRRVRLAAEIDDIAVIGEGLEPGDRVLLTRVSPAIDGTRLAPAADARAAARLAAAAGGERP